MKRKEKISLVDKPWLREPDVWRGEHMLARRAPGDYMGHWNGYVGVGPAHWLHGKDYDCDELYNIQVHGGLTYSGDGWLDDNGKTNDLWWFGFDCAHAGDLVPARLDRDLIHFDGDVYRDLEFVKAEILSLAQQIARLKRGRLEA